MTISPLVLGRSALGDLFAQSVARGVRESGNPHRQSGGLSGAYADAGCNGLADYVEGLGRADQRLRALQLASTARGVDSDQWEPGEAQQLLLSRLGDGPAPEPGLLLSELVAAAVEDLTAYVARQGQERAVLTNRYAEELE